MEQASLLATTLVHKFQQALDESHDWEDHDLTLGCLFAIRTASLFVGQKTRWIRVLENCIENKRAHSSTTDAERELLEKYSVSGDVKLQKFSSDFLSMWTVWLTNGNDDTVVAAMRPYLAPKRKLKGACQLSYFSHDSVLGFEIPVSNNLARSAWGDIPSHVWSLFDGGISTGSNNVIFDIKTDSGGNTAAILVGDYSYIASRQHAAKAETKIEFKLYQDGVLFATVSTPLQCVWVNTTNKIISEVLIAPITGNILGNMIFSWDGEWN